MFINGARRGDNLWAWWLLTSIFIFFLMAIFQLPLAGVALLKQRAGDISYEQIKKFEETADFSLIGVGSNIGLILLILGFLGAIVGLWLGVRFLHKRPFKTLITPFENIRWNRIFFSFGIWFGMSVIIEVVSYFMDPSSYIFRFNGLSFFVLVIVAFLLLPIQTSAEELVFRGYMLQGIGLLTKTRWIPILITSLLFGLIHIFNPEIKEFGVGVMMSYYMSVGLFLGIITVMDDGLELALGIHAATNIFGAVFTTYEGSALKTDALLISTQVNPPLMLVAVIIVSTIFYLICHKKYNWPPISKIFDPIVNDTNEINESYT